VVSFRKAGSLITSSSDFRIKVEAVMKEPRGLTVRIETAGMDVMARILMLNLPGTLHIIDEGFSLKGEWNIPRH
jgi:hypothetical protein